uniref:Uncharacterized protein n=1 Tax=Heliothis virescens TaxID=7102 RepID=A0A2A4JJB2_HELVI
MCFNINVNLPTVGSFLMLYSLRFGCIVILIWTVFRSVFFLVFLVNAMMVTFLPRPPRTEYRIPRAMGCFFYVAFVVQIFLIVTESFVLVFSIYLGMGLYYDTSYRISQYLVCRFCTWLAETSCLVVISIANTGQIGYYLVILMIVILEFYGFIVVYSYYTDLVEEERKCRMCCEMESSQCLPDKRKKKKDTRSICEC